MTGLEREADRRDRDRLPLPALLALAMTGFTAILTETLTAGLLPQLATGLKVGEAAAGQLVTAYALRSLVAAIPLVALTQGWRRKPTLLAAIAGFLVFNTVTALSSLFWLTLGARFLAGVAAGLAWGLLAGYARRLVDERLQGRALAVAMVGTPLALSLGVPAGTWLGSTVGWRLAFLAMSASTLGLILWVMRAVPDTAGQAVCRRQSIGHVFHTPGLRPILATVFSWMTAHNILYTYITPFAALSGSQNHVGLLLLTFGVAALIGIWITGLLVDRMLRTLVLVSLLVFAGVALLLGLLSGVALVVTAVTALWGLSFGGAATQLQTAAGDVAGEGVDLANAMITTVWNGAIAGGGIVGGLMLDHAGAGSFPWAVLTLALIALGIAALARHHGFTPGPRISPPLTNRRTIRCPPCS